MILLRFIFPKLSFCGSSSSSSVGAGISVVLDVWPTTKSWILGFLEVFLAFLVLLGNSWFFLERKKNLVNLGFLLEIRNNPSNSWFFAGDPRIPK